MKKLIITFVLVTSIIGVVSRCCSPIIPFYEITGLSSTIRDAGLKVVEGAITADSLVISVNVLKNFVAQQRSFSLMNQAYGLQPCPEDGESGLKDDIVEFSIFSNVDFLGIDAGKDLSSELSDSTYTDFDKEEFNDWNGSGFSLRLYEKQVGFLDLNLYLKYESESIDTFPIASFQWL